MDPQLRASCEAVLPEAWYLTVLPPLQTSQHHFLGCLWNWRGFLTSFIVKSLAIIIYESNSGFSAYSMGMEIEHELLAQSRKVRRWFSLSKSFTEQLLLLTKILYWIKSDTFVIHQFSMILHYIIVFITILYCSFDIIETKDYCLSGEQTQRNKMFWELQTTAGFLRFGIAWESVFLEENITLHILEFLTKATTGLYYMNPQRINKHLNQSWLNKL